MGLVKGRRRWWLLVLIPVGAVVLLGPVLALVYDFYSIPSGSMLPTLEPDDRVLVRGASGDEVDRGDVIIYEAVPAVPLPGVTEPPPAAEAVARVLGLPGEELSASDGQLLVDGAPVDEPYLDDGTVTQFFDEPSITVGEDELFVLGDNRTDARDSRVFGPIPFDAVVGRVTRIWWPLGHAGGV